jgi:hypothetical protein
MRTETESVSFAAENLAECHIAGAPALCGPRKEGPIVVTDVLTLAGCPARMFIGSSISDNAQMGLRWVAEANAHGLTGARLFVAGGEWLQVAMALDGKADRRDPRCVLTWAGYRPRLVPTRM